MRNQNTVWQDQSSEAILRQMSILEQAWKEYGLDQPSEPSQLVNESSYQVSITLDANQLEKNRRALGTMQKLADDFNWK